MGPGVVNSVCLIIHITYHTRAAINTYHTTFTRPRLECNNTPFMLPGVRNELRIGTEQRTDFIRTDERLVEN